MSRESLRAADPRRSAWVSANAGSGKTYTLANRVTRLLLDGAKPERILCLTYTKAAAAEMSGRLFAQLGEWAMLDDADLCARIAEIGVPGLRGEDLRKARRLFALALETPGGLKIQTIHSFCQSVLARFPLEAGVPATFRVLDDQTTREMGEEASRRVLERAGSGEATLAGAVAYIGTHADETKLKAALASGLGSDRRKFERLLAKHGQDMGAVSVAIFAAHGLAVGESYERIAEAFCAEMRQEESRLRDVATWLSGGKSGDCASASLLARAMETGHFEEFFRIFATQKGEPRKRLATNDLITANGPLHTYFLDVARRCLDAEQRCRAARAAALADAALVLAQAASVEYANAKRIRSVLDYDDLIAGTLSLLETRDAAAWVLFKLDGGLDHILVDEGQDTSPEQWRIVQRLADEFFAGEGARSDTTRTLFVVGDEKQSIFSFQGADPTQFDVQRATFEERAKEGGETFETVHLATSRRSAPEILSFVDTVFADPSAREGVTSSDAPIIHRAFREQAKGRVEVWPPVKPLPDPKTDLWQRPVDIPAPDSPVVRLAAQIAGRVRGWTRGEFRLPGREKPVTPGDIMVLMPRREPFANEFIRQLKLLGVPVAGADRLKLKDHIAVMDLMALGRFALLPEDDLTLAAVLRSPLAGLSEEGLYSLCTGRGGTLWRELERRRHDTPAMDSAHAFLAECLERADFMPPFEFYAHVLGVRDRRRLLYERLGTECGDAIDEFLSLTIAYETLNPPSLEGFLHWMETGEAEVKRDMDRGRNEVRVMTVHGAKGLEADIVILPDTTATLPSPASLGTLLYTDEGVFFPLSKALAPRAVENAKRVVEAEMLKEHRRLLYVALTRPRDQLYIYGYEGKKGVRPNSWYPLLDQAARKIGTCEPQTEEPDAAPYVIGGGTLEPVSAPGAIEQRAELPDWVHNLPAPEAETPRLIRPSLAAGDDEPPVLSPTKGARYYERGLLLHTLFAQLPKLPREARRIAASKYLAARDVADHDASALIDAVSRVLDDPAFAAVFDPAARAEAAIMAELPELGANARVSGRIDRLAVAADTVLAVDFKTNRTPPESLEAVPRLYLAQMALYRAALAKVFPGRRVACALLWTETPRLMRLPDTLLDAEMAAIRDRLAS